MLASTLWGHARDSPFQDLEQGLLYAFAGDIASDGGILILLRDLVDFVNIDDALLGALHITPGILQELQNDVLDVFAHITGFRQSRRIRNGKRDFQNACESLSQKGLARPRGTDQQNIGLGELDVAAYPR